MEGQQGLPPVRVVREQVIQALTDAFANDHLSVTELEDRLEKAYRAETAGEALALVAGLPGVTAGSAGLVRSAVPVAVEVPHASQRERFLSFMSSQSRRGIWTVPRALDVVALFSDTTLDLTQAALPKDIVDIHVSVYFANVRIVVPSGLRVVNRVGAFAANVESEPALDLAPMTQGAPVVRITGNAVFANVEIVSGRKG